MILFASLLSSEDKEAEAEASPPSRKRAEILAETRRNAEADAIRHAEDLLEREFPIVSTAERTAESRLADLQSEYTEKRGELEAEKESLGRRVEAADRELQLAEKALRKKGVPEDELGLPPFSHRTIQFRQAVVGIAAAGALGLIISPLVASPVLTVAVFLAALVLIFWLVVAPGDEAESLPLRRLRAQRLKAAKTVQNLSEKEARNIAAIEQLERTAHSKGLGEVTFAGEIVAAYVNAAFSALPAGSLEGGRKVAAQRQPQVEIPAWLQALAPEDE